jgi:hypothetical protein
MVLLRGRAWGQAFGTPSARTTLYLGERFPVYAVFIYAKNERSDLSPRQKRLLMRIVSDIKAQAQKRSRR